MCSNAECCFHPLPPGTALEDWRYQTVDYPQFVALLSKYIGDAPEIRKIGNSVWHVWEFRWRMPLTPMINLCQDAWQRRLAYFYMTITPGGDDPFPYMTISVIPWGVEW
jgi:hypothetical protein